MGRIRIIGPVKMREMYKGKKRIILISDVHSDYLENTCRKNPKILITEFLEKLLLRDPKEQWDLYLEQGAGQREFFYKRKMKSQYYKKRQTENLTRRREEYYLKLTGKRDDFLKESLLQLIFDYFASQNCFIKLKCPIRNTRFHFIDIRHDKFGYDCQISMVSWSDLKLNYIYKYSKKLRNSYQEDYPQILKDLRADLENFFHRFINALNNIIKCFKKTDKIAKQINNSELRSNIMKYYKSRILMTIRALIYIYNIMKEKEEYFIKFFMIATIKDAKTLIKVDELYMNVVVKKIYGKKYIKLYKTLKKYKELKEDAGFTALEDIYDNATILVMDLYFLGRMSRKFYNKSQNNVIVIAGDAHIDNYVNFLKSAGFKTKWKSEQESKKCSVIPNILSH